MARLLCLSLVGLVVLAGTGCGYTAEEMAAARAAPAPPPPPPPPPQLAPGRPEYGYAPASYPPPAMSACDIEGVAYEAADCPLDAVPKHAADLLGCPVESIAVRRLAMGSEHSSHGVVLADGCGEQVVYAYQPWSKPTEWWVLSRFALGPTRRAVK